MSRISEIAKEMKTWWGNDGSDIEVQNALDEIIRLDEATDHEAEQSEPNLSDIPTTTEDCSMVEKISSIEKRVGKIIADMSKTDCPWK